MQNQRVLVAFGIAWLTALLLSWWVYKRTTAPQARDVVSVTAAAHDLPVGKRIQREDLKQITLDRNGRRINQVFFQSCKYNPGFAEDFFTKAALDKRSSEVGVKKSKAEKKKEKEAEKDN